MRKHGTLTRWNDDRGFGFIEPAGGGPEVFVHVSAFPRGSGRPSNGELVSYEVDTVRGRPQAVRLTRTAYAPRATRGYEPRARPQRERRSLAGKLLPVTVLFAIVAAFTATQRTSDRASANVAPSSATPDAVPAFHCDGRTSCGQMRSCAEARYFLASCPGTEMDGDHDGIPCEDQWCG